MNDPTAIAVATDPQHQRFQGVTAHGWIPFDVPYITEIVPGLWQGGCAAPLILPDFINHVVSLYPWEKYRVKHELRSNLAVRMVNECRKTGTVLVHCQAGLNRSALIVASALLLQCRDPGDVIDTLRTARSPAVLCNNTFVDWLHEQDWQQWW